jgi:hypothetical protein
MKNFLLCLITCCQLFFCNAQVNIGTNFEFYKKAIDKILVTNNSTIDVRSTCFNVSREVLSFNAFVAFFKEQILLQSTIQLQPLNEQSNPVVKNDQYMTSMGCKRNRKLKFFFTETQGGIFFTEVIKFENRRTDAYNERPHFGQSDIYMF